MFSYSTIVLFFVYNVHNSVNRTHSNGLIGNVYARVLNIHVCGCSVKQHAPPALRASAPTPESRAQPPTACTHRDSQSVLRNGLTHMSFTEWVIHLSFTRLCSGCSRPPSPPFRRPPLRGRRTPARPCSCHRVPREEREREKT